jgi:hypothetical protein
MIEFYALIAAFMLGVYIGASYERGEKPDMSDIFKLITLSVIWPVVIAVLVYACIKGKTK